MADSPLHKDVDVAVIGGGPAGAAAATLTPPCFGRLGIRDRSPVLNRSGTSRG